MDLDEVVKDVVFHDTPLAQRFLRPLRQGILALPWIVLFVIVPAFILLSLICVAYGVL